jgi:sec-independent protein translocase protein TatA
VFGLGLPEIVIILVIVLIIFGPSKLPQLGKALGEGIRSIRKGTEDDTTEAKKPVEKAAEAPAEEKKVEDKNDA